MRHRVKGRKFHRMRGERKAFVRNLANDLIRAGKIETTEARAKEIRPVVEKLVTIAKAGSVTARRLLLSRVHNTTVVQKLVGDLGVKYKERPGGYLRIIKLAKTKKRDGSRLSVVEFV